MATHKNEWEVLERILKILEEEKVLDPPADEPVNRFQYPRCLKVTPTFC